MPSKPDIKYKTLEIAAGLISIANELAEICLKTKQEEYEIYLYGYSVLMEQLLQVAVEWLLEMPFLLLQDQLVGPLPVRRCLHLSFFSLRTR